MVALHRAVALARKNPQARLLLTTFSEPLARSLSAKLVVLAPETGGIAPRITVSDWHGVADELFQLIHGRRPADCRHRHAAHDDREGGGSGRGARINPALSALGVD